ncbi:hypothetical protein MAPG_05833 [Magnaporthiopsis poae ATCC 64411]|uniref:GPI anchored protein n=1 Tax=Magnaporthiopsis poae (strain ATCC 64411 / 73-15) TaxID=644358 RepID=A0A0C4E0F9_MAGP6|nr:hypothetical protein MAPG_05833 [Magnaporthiopsis poae ATCC 64411]
MRSKSIIALSTLAAASAAAASQSTTASSSLLQQATATTPPSASVATTTVNVWLFNLSPDNVTFPVSASVVDGGSSGAKNWTTYSLNCNTAELLCRESLNGLTYMTGPVLSAMWTSSGGDVGLFTTISEMPTDTHAMSPSLLATATTTPPSAETVRVGTTRSGSCGIATGCVDEAVTVQVEKGHTVKSYESASISVSVISSIPLTVTSSISAAATPAANTTTVSSGVNSATPTSTKSSTGGVPRATGGAYAAGAAVVAAVGGIWVL